MKHLRFDVSKSLWFQRVCMWKVGLHVRDVPPGLPGHQPRGRGRGRGRRGRSRRKPRGRSRCSGHPLVLMWSPFLGKQCFHPALVRVVGRHHLIKVRWDLTSDKSERTQKLKCESNLSIGGTCENVTFKNCMDKTFDKRLKHVTMRKAWWTNTILSRPAFRLKHCQRHNGPRNWLRDLN